MNVRELIDILKDYPADAEVELAVVAPVEDEDHISVDRYGVDGVLPWDDDAEGNPGPVIWLVGGEEDDVDAFLDAIEDDDPDDVVEHGHDHHTHDEGDQDGHASASAADDDEADAGDTDDEEAADGVAGDKS